MPAFQDRGVPFSVPPPSTLEERMPDWHGVWVFLQVHRSGSLRACAKRYNMTVSSIRRRIDQLERVVGHRLLTRHVDGIRLTAEGEHLLGIGLGMEREALALVRMQDALTCGIDGTVRIAVTEGLGAVWLAPRAADFTREHPNLRLDFACAMRSVDVLRMEADVAVQLSRPEAPDVKVVRLGHLHVMPYASRSYADRYGVPSTIEELASHRLALQIAEQTSTAEILSQIFRDVPFRGAIAITTNTSTAHALAIANGVGIGWLPTYVTPLQSGLIPIECGAHAKLDIWMTYHPDAEQIPRVRVAIAWIRSCFDPRHFPFFSEQRFRPDALPPIAKLATLKDWMPEYR